MVSLSITKQFFDDYKLADKTTAMFWDTCPYEDHPCLCVNRIFETDNKEW